MQLRAKTLLAFGASTIVALMFVVGVGSYILLSAFTQTERRDIERSTRQVERLIQNELGTMRITVTDYGAWDDMYAYAVDHSKEFEKSNFEDAVIQNLKLNVLAVFDAENQLVYGTGFDWQKGERRALPQEVLKAYQPGSALTNYRDTQDAKTGLLQTSDGVLMMVAQPIVTSNKEGPIHGTLVHGRLLDERVQMRLNELSEKTLKLIPLGASMSPEVRDSFEILQQHPTDVDVHVHGGDKIDGVLLLHDIFQQPISLLEVEEPRHDYQQGLQSVSILVIGLVFVVFLSGFVLYLLLNRFILQRIVLLDCSVDAVTSTGSTKGIKVLPGDDELSRFSTIMIDAFHLQERAKAREVSEKKRLKSLLVQERALDCAKSEFISIASHELKAPLAAVKWTVELLGDERKHMSMTGRKQIDTLQELNERLVRLVEDLLDVSRIETGSKKFAVVRELTDVRDLLKNAVSEANTYGAERNVTVRIGRHPRICKLSLDASKMRRVFQNILSNGVAYSNKGGEVQVEIVRQKDEVVWSFRDEGIGIPRDAQAHLYEKFYRADNAKAHRVTGTGLGLYITKAMVEAQGGKIWFTSEENKGTTFSVALPIRKGDTCR